ncbi:MAG: YggS family pyridoxal phosphate-dependent enzyme [Pirellulales bacterium]|nr:YggS family pyridoxal phosphate-dependent enzyme [Pirellulales bacterium]
MPYTAAQIAENLAAVRASIADAAARSGRPADAITLVCVTKYAGVETARAVAEAGCFDLGESRPQELWHKHDTLANPALRWHLIGHLQRNKVARTLPCAYLIHSVDSLRLAAAIEENARNQTSPARVLIEVNISDESAKHGFAPEEVEQGLVEMARLPHLRVLGLMGMASGDGKLATAQRQFASLRELRDRLARNCPPEISLGELSMGMSQDYGVAIEEGATLVRVGSALFEGIET